MAFNKKLFFIPRKIDVGVADECSICGRKKLGEQAVVACFQKMDPPEYAAVYCHACVLRMHLVASGASEAETDDAIQDAITRAFGQHDRASKKIAKSPKGWGRKRMTKTHRKGKKKAKRVVSRARRRVDKLEAAP